MKSKRRIAVLIALMLATPIGIAALEESASSERAEAAETPAVQVEPVAQPAESPAPPVASSEPADPIGLLAESAARPEIGSEMVVGTAPVGGLVRAQPSDTFPEGSMSSDYVVLLPPQIAYFEQIEQERRQLVALGDVYPEGSRPESEWHMLPAQIAYFDRLDREYVASAEPMTQSDAMPDSSAAADESRNPLRVAWDYVAGLFKRMGAAISGWGSSS